MARKASADQMAFDFFSIPEAVKAVPAIVVRAADPLKEAIIGAKLEHNDFLLQINRTLQNRAEIPFPSRLYRFPVAFMDRDRFGGEESKLLLQHPLIGESEYVAPFLEEIEAKTGIRPHYEACDEFGRDRGELPRWWHAVDLCNNEHWRHLLDTIQYCGTREVFNAVRFHIENCGLSTVNARKIMRELDADEPEDRSRAAILGDGMSPGGTLQGISPNIRLRGSAGAWLAIHAVEDGWLKKKGSFMMVTPTTLNARELAKAA